jgi:hypothetical protein
MPKTNPIGVRFNQEVLDDLQTKKLASTPQQALVFLENFYRTYTAVTPHKVGFEELKKPEVKDLNTTRSPTWDLREAPSKYKTDLFKKKE